jgi:hypothetical protein
MGTAYWKYRQKEKIKVLVVVSAHHSWGHRRALGGLYA